MIKTKLYSPLQIVTIAFIGGPFAAVYVLKKNFDALSNKAGSRLVAIWGSVFIAALFGAMPFFPEKTPHYVIPIAYALTARIIAEKYQMSKQAIRDSEHYCFQSNWKVVGVTLVGLIVFTILGIIWILGLMYVGLV